MFYHYHQNNSGGATIEPALAICVEAISPEQANRIAQEHGAYFNGCDEGRDCDCCGDRWTEAFYDGTLEPFYYNDRYWIEAARERNLPLALIVYANGKTEKRYS